MDRKDLERAPRSELLKTIERQQELILRRETRLRGTVKQFNCQRYSTAVLLPEVQYSSFTARDTVQQFNC